MTLQPGTVLGGFQVVAHVGTGGMGEVYHARDLKLGRSVAVKLLPAGFIDDDVSVNRLIREARLLASLNHPNIATLYSLEADSTPQFLVMEFVAGETLEERVAAGPFDIDSAVHLFTQIADGVAVAHRKGVIHRDLKPANIKVLEDRRVKILDFGIARALVAEGGASRSPSRDVRAADPGSRPTPQEDSFPFDVLSAGTLSDVTRAGTVVGTPGYMSPEQAFGDVVGKPTDVWAFGCCLFEALTGSPAFPGSSARQIVLDSLLSQPNWALLEGVPSGVRDVVYGCLAKDQDKRVATFTEIASQLRSSRSRSSDPGALDRVSEQPSLEHRLFDMSRDMLCVAGLDGFLKRTNPAFERTLGWTAPELYARPFIDFVHEQDREATLREMEKLGQGISTLSFSNRYQCRDGSFRRLYWSAHLDPDTHLLYGVARFEPGPKED